MQRTVNLDDDQPPVRAPPRGVQVSPAARRIAPDGLQLGSREPVAPAQPEKVDLAERIGTLADVLDGREERRSVAQAW